MRSRHTRAFVLLSGGIDSATALYRARNDYVHVTAVSLYYGQRHSRELMSALAICERIGVKCETISLPGDMLGGDGVMLTDTSVKVPNAAYDQLKGISPTYVPYRNGVMLSAIAAHASKYVMRVARDEQLDSNSPLLKDLVALYFGAHAEDAKNWAYPDCTPEFIGAQANAIYIGSYQTTRLIAPFMYNTKAEIVRQGVQEFAVPYELTWSCYVGGDVHCGVCPTCRARKDAFRIAGFKDPTVYAE